MSGAREWGHARDSRDDDARSVPNGVAPDGDPGGPPLLGSDTWAEGDESDHRSTPLRAVSRVCDIVDALTQHPDGATLSALSAEVDLPKSSTFRYLAALELRDYVERTLDGVGYRLGPRNFGQPAPGMLRLDRLVTVAKPLMERLVEPPVQGCLLAGLGGSKVRYHWVAVAPFADPRVPRVGERDWLDNTAAGKAVAAQLADEAVTALLVASGIRQSSGRPAPSTPRFLRELHHIRGEGYAVTTNERYPDVRGIAVPIGGDPLALGVAGLTAELTDDLVLPVVRRLRRAGSALARGLR